MTLYYNKGAWGFQVQPAPSCTFRTVASPSHLLCSFCVITDTARHPAVPSPPPSLHFKSFRVPADRGSSLPPGAEKVTSPSLPNGESEAQGEEQFAKGHSEVGEEPWRPGYPSHRAHLSPPLLLLLIFQMKDPSTRRREEGLELLMVMVS